MRLFEQVYFNIVSKGIINSIKKNAHERNIYVFGANEATVKLTNVLRDYGVEVYGVLDSQCKLYDSCWQNMRMQSVNNYSIRESYLIISDKTIHKSFAKHFIDKMGKNDYYVYDRSSLLKTIAKMDIINGIRKGRIVYLALRKKWKEELLLMCPYPGTGDAYLTGMYLQEYINRNCIKKYRILVPGKSFFSILYLFGIDSTKITILSSREMNNLRNWVAYKGTNSLNLQYLMYWGLPYQTVEIFEGFNRLSFPELFRTCALGITDNVVPAKMMQEITITDAKKNIEKLGLSVGRTVIIAPYANSFADELELKWWEKLAYSLQKRGFCVATNCSGNEQPIPNTISVAFPYSEIVPTMDICGYFIGVRSGLCDLISNSTCKKVIIYQNFITSRRMEFFSLLHLNPYQELTEVKYQGSLRSKTALLDDILNGGYFAEK